MCSLIKRVWYDKPLTGKEYQMTHWKSDSLIVPKKLGNAGGGKGGSVAPRSPRRHHPDTELAEDENKIVLHNGGNQKGRSGAQCLNWTRWVLMGGLTRESQVYPPNHHRVGGRHSSLRGRQHSCNRKGEVMRTRRGLRPWRDDKRNSWELGRADVFPKRMLGQAYRR